MRKPVAVIVALVAMCCLCGVALAAGPRGVPHRYLPGSLDGDLRTVVRTTDGVSFAAWSYRSGAEYDIAISRSVESGVWTEPEFFGADDGIDQIDPALAVDADGNVFLAYTDPASRGIRLAALRADSTSWSQSHVLRPKAAGRSFTSAGLLVIDDHVAVAFAEGGRTTIIDLPRLWLLGEGAISGLTITESGDPVGYQPGGDEGSGFGNGDGGVRTIGEDDRPVEVFTPVRKRGTGGVLQ